MRGEIVIREKVTNPHNHKNPDYITMYKVVFRSTEMMQLKLKRIMNDFKIDNDQTILVLRHFLDGGIVPLKAKKIPPKPITIKDTSEPGLPQRHIHLSEYEKRIKDILGD